METIKITGIRLSSEEREAHLYLDPIERVWTLESYLPKYFRKAIKQGWKPIREYVYDDGTVCGMVLTAPERSVTIRSVEKKKLSKKQLDILCEDEE